MSGGVAYVLDLSHDLYQRLNEQLVDMSLLEDERDIRIVKQLLIKHYQKTNSQLAKTISDHFADYIPHFKKIIPRDYAKMLSSVEKFEKRGDSKEEALFNAFTSMHQGGRING